MKEETEFQEIGKNTPYKVPDGFFEKISEKTLRKAKQREQNRRKMLITLRTFAVAASLSAIALLAYFMPGTEEPVIKQMVQNKQTEVKDTIRLTDAITKKITIAEIKKGAPVKTTYKETKPEGITDVLSEMSDDELLQLAAMYKSDLFIDESPQ
jgi:hypothetical protein